MANQLWPPGGRVLGGATPQACKRTYGLHSHCSTCARARCAWKGHLKACTCRAPVATVVPCRVCCTRVRSPRRQACTLQASTRSQSSRACSTPPLPLACCLRLLQVLTPSRVAPLLLLACVRFEPGFSLHFNTSPDCSTLHCKWKQADHAGEWTAVRDDHLAVGYISDSQSFYSGGVPRFSPSVPDLSLMSLLKSFHCAEVCCLEVSLFVCL